MTSRTFDDPRPFQKQVISALADSQLRANLGHATSTIRNKRAKVVAELEDWEALRDHGAYIKDLAQSILPELIRQVEVNVTATGGKVHFAKDAAEANQIAIALTKSYGAKSVVKIKSMATQEIELNKAFEEAGLEAFETDLAELIVQLGDDLPSHILVPAIHKNRSQIREIFIEKMGRSGVPAPKGLTDSPKELAAAARNHLRARFLESKVAISGGNFLVAETGSIVIVESEGNGRMCLTLPETLISVVGIDKIVPDWSSLEVFLQLLPRSSTGERMNPYTSIFTGVTAGDGPKNFHLILIDNGRTEALQDPVGREVLRCIRCSACLNVCPVYERAGGHSYGSTYPGPIGAVLVPQIRRGSIGKLEKSLPYASSLCGACYEVCPVKIDIPKLLVELRSQNVDRARDQGALTGEKLLMEVVYATFRSPRLFASSLDIARKGASLIGKRKVNIAPPPLSAWTKARSLPLPRGESFRDWMRENHPDHIVASAKAMSGESITKSTTNGLRQLGRFGLHLQHDLAKKRLRGNSDGMASFKVPNHQPIATPYKADLSIGQTIDEFVAPIKAITSSGFTKPIEPTTSYRTKGGLSPHEIVDLFIDRTIDYKATITRCNEKELAKTIQELLSKNQSSSLVAPKDFNPYWLSDKVLKFVTFDDQISHDRLDAIDSVVTTSAVAVASSGTIILDGGEGQGRRAISLIVDHHIAVVFEDQIVEVLPEAIGRINHRAPQTWISGPSATSDIELERVEGVHGPRKLDVIVVRRG
ncbi:MAG: LUD domain-containing protein [Actinomycetota bacterium]|nr:LUD domain-containing protein [Actinomycetota bacterium]MDA8277738.1 LUD domain-containing protein [Actinomycetota bacterium]